MNHILTFIALVIAPMVYASDDPPPASSQAESAGGKATANTEGAAPASDAATESPDKHFVELSFGDITVKHRAKPRWPATGAGKKGTVCEVRMYVDATGKPERAVSACGLSQFERAASNAGMKWRFEPLLVDGKATPFTFKLRIKFAKK